MVQSGPWNTLVSSRCRCLCSTGLKTRWFSSQGRGDNFSDIYSNLEWEDVCLVQQTLFFRELVKRARSRDKKLTMIPVRWHKHHLTFFLILATYKLPSQGASHHVLLDQPTLVENILIDWVLQRSWTKFRTSWNTGSFRGVEQVFDAQEFKVHEKVDHLIIAPDQTIILGLYIFFRSMII